MTERWELVELIGQTLGERNIAASEQTVEAILDSIEDLIRADERAKAFAPDKVRAMAEQAVDALNPLIRSYERIALHAEVEALPGWQHGDAVLRSDVLALLRGDGE